MDINEFLRQRIKILKVKDYQFQEIRERVHCRDGFNISVQASRTHYCHPREDGLQLYSEVELGFPSTWKTTKKKLREQFRQHSDAYSKKFKQRLTCNTVFAYVPVELVDELLNAHGGIYTYQDFCHNMIAKLMEET